MVLAYLTDSTSRPSPPRCRYSRPTLSTCTNLPPCSYRSFRHQLDIFCQQPQQLPRWSFNSLFAIPQPWPCNSTEPSSTPTETPTRKPTRGSSTPRRKFFVRDTNESSAGTTIYQTINAFCVALSLLSIFLSFPITTLLLDKYRDALL